jgi:hypothetical protein
MVSIGSVRKRLPVAAKISFFFAFVVARDRLKIRRKRLVSRASPAPDAWHSNVLLPHRSPLAQWRERNELSEQELVHICANLVPDPLLVLGRKFVQPSHKGLAFIGEEQSRDTPIAWRGRPTDEAAPLERIEHGDEVGLLDSQRIRHPRLAETRIALDDRQDRVLDRPNIHHVKGFVEILKHCDLGAAQSIAELRTEGAEVEVSISSANKIENPRDASARRSPVVRWRGRRGRSETTGRSSLTPTYLQPRMAVGLACLGAEPWSAGEAREFLLPAPPAIETDRRRNEW